MISNEEKINIILVRIREMVFKIDYLINYMNSGIIEESIFYKGIDVNDMGNVVKDHQAFLLALEKELETLTNQG